MVVFVGDMYNRSVRTAGFHIRGPNQFLHLTCIHALSHTAHAQREEVACAHTTLAQITPVKPTQPNQTGYKGTAKKQGRVMRPAELKERVRENTGGRHKHLPAQQLHAVHVW
jgi:hypothetical protein